MEQVGIIEKHHEERYLKLLENVKNGKVFEKKNLLFGYVISVDIVMKEQLLLKLVQYVDTPVLTLLRKTTITNHINDVEDMCKKHIFFFLYKKVCME